MATSGHGSTGHRSRFFGRLRARSRDAVPRVLARSSCEVHPGFRLLRLRGAPEACGVQHGVVLRALAGGAPARGAPRWRSRRRRLPEGLDDEARALERTAPGLAVARAPDLEAGEPGRGWRAGGAVGLAVGGREQDAELLHLALYEAPAATDPEPLLVVRSPAEGLAHVALGVAGGLGVVAGMNEAGLSVSWLSGRINAGGRAGGVRGRRPAVPLSLALRLALERARTLTEAARVVARALPRPGEDRVLLASAEAGQAVLLELCGARHGVVPMRAGALFACGRGAAAGVASPPEEREEREERDETDERDEAPLAREEALARLLTRLPRRAGPEAVVELLRDPWPREGRGLLLTTPDPDRHPGVPRASAGLLLDPAGGRIWAVSAASEGVHAPWLCFDLRRGGIRRPEADVAGSGLPAAARAAEALLGGRPRQAAEALQEASALDPEHAVVLLLRGLAGEPEPLRRLLAIRPDCPHARLARAWLGEGDRGTAVRVPVPSICDPRAWLHPAGERILPEPG